MSLALLRVGQCEFLPCVEQYPRASEVGSAEGYLAVVQQRLGVERCVLADLWGGCQHDVHAPGVVGGVVGLKIFNYPGAGLRTSAGILGVPGYAPQAPEGVQGAQEAFGVDLDGHFLAGGLGEQGMGRRGHGAEELGQWGCEVAKARGVEPEVLVGAEGSVGFQ